MRMLTRVSPANDLGHLHGRLERLLGDPWGDAWTRPGGNASFIPPLDAYETPETLVVRLEIAGIDPGKIDVSAEGGQLVIAGEKEREELPENSRWYHGERLAGTFRRVLELPVAIDNDAVTAEAKNGLLTIHLPKRAEILPKRIDVKVS